MICLARENMWRLLTTWRKTESMNFFSQIFQYFDALFTGIGYALALDPQLYAYVSANSNSSWLVMGVVFLAGASMLLGQSVVLFVNRVRRGRFALSIALNGVLFVISYVIWGAAIGLIGSLLFADKLEILSLMRMVGLSTAPLIFGFFILIPWMGPFIGKLLNIWSFLILLTVVEFGFDVGLVRALICVGLGWLLMLGLTNFIGKPFIALRNRIWHAVTGTSMDASTQDLLLEFSQSHDAPALLREGRQ